MLGYVQQRQVSNKNVRCRSETLSVAKDTNINSNLHIDGHFVSDMIDWVIVFSVLLCSFKTFVSSVAYTLDNSSLWWLEKTLDNNG